MISLDYTLDFKITFTKFQKSRTTCIMYWSKRKVDFKRNAQETKTKDKYSTGK